MNIHITTSRSPPFTVKNEPIQKMYKIVFSDRNTSHSEKKIHVYNHALFNTSINKWEDTIHLNTYSGEWYIYPEHMALLNPYNLSVEITYDITENNPNGKVLTIHSEKSDGLENIDFDIQNYIPYNRELPVFCDKQSTIRNNIQSVVDYFIPIQHDDYQSYECSPRTLQMVENGEIQPPPLERSKCYRGDSNEQLILSHNI